MVLRTSMSVYPSTRFDHSCQIDHEVTSSIPICNLQFAISSLTRFQLLSFLLHYRLLAILFKFTARTPLKYFMLPSRLGSCQIFLAVTSFYNLSKVYNPLCSYSMCEVDFIWIVLVRSHHICTFLVLFTWWVSVRYSLYCPCMFHSIFTFLSFILHICTVHSLPYCLIERRKISCCINAWNFFGGSGLVKQSAQFSSDLQYWKEMILLACAILTAW